ncbi:MAG: hypothetical protein M1840_001285 [Geoglossum simile]|nr:MAG: hypothetical protein M1840_001285 [Geoglossum simile]
MRLFRVKIKLAEGATLTRNTLNCSWQGLRKYWDSEALLAIDINPMESRKLLQLPSTQSPRWITSLGCQDNPLDQNIMAGKLLQLVSRELDTLNEDVAIPTGSRLVRVSRHGKSLWNQTFRVDTELKDKTTKSYFLKVADGDNAAGMMRGEFESITAIRAICPELAPRPIATGVCDSPKHAYFLLYDFVDMTGALPDAITFTAMLAKLHMDGKPPEEGYGFHVPSYHGTLEQKNVWEPTWEEFFSSALQHSLGLEEHVHGPNKILKNLSPIVFSKVIPRLLRPLETRGRTIKPCLVHGDLWRGNISTDAATGQPIIFDACANELGEWRSTRSEIGHKFITAYHLHVPKSPPEEDFDDRNALYSM